MKRNASPETVNAVLGGSLTPYRRTLVRRDNDATVLRDPEDLRIACGLVTSAVVGNTNLHLPIIDAAFGSSDERNNGQNVDIFAWAEGTTELLARTLESHSIAVEIANEEVALGALRVITMAAMQENTFAVCEATVQPHRHIYVQEPFTTDEHNQLFDGLHEAGIVSDRIHALVREIGCSGVRTPWSIREADVGRPAL